MRCQNSRMLIMFSAMKGQPCFRGFSLKNVYVKKPWERAEVIYVFLCHYFLCGVEAVSSILTCLDLQINLYLQTFSLFITTEFVTSALISAIC